MWGQFPTELYRLNSMFLTIFSDVLKRFCGVWCAGEMENPKCKYIWIRLVICLNNCWDIPSCKSNVHSSINSINLRMWLAFRDRPKATSICTMNIFSTQWNRYPSRYMQMIPCVLKLICFNCQLEFRCHSNRHLKRSVNFNGNFSLLSNFYSKIISPNSETIICRRDEKSSWIWNE